MINELKPDFIFSDDRGQLMQLVHEGYRQVNVCVSKEGTVRGGHFHKLNKETFYIISGKVKITASEDGRKKIYNFGDGDMFEITKNTIHSLEFIKDTTMVVMYDIGVELPDGTKDIVPGE